MAETSSSSSSTKSDEEKVEMLDRLLTRLALCDDSKLQPLLSKLLPFTVSSLSSNSSAVRNKVLEILSHVNKRVKHQPEIALPLSELWNIYSEANAASMVRNFCILYIEMAMDRADTKEKENLAATLLSGVSKLPLQHHEIILRLATKVMGECHSSGVNDEVAAKYKTICYSQDRKLFLEFCLHTILYQQSSQSRECPPGLSIAQTHSVTGKQPLKSDILLTRKLGILNVIEAMELAPELIYPLYVAASVDCQEPVVKRGEELLKKKAAGANLDDSDLINTLFLLFNGTAGAQNVAPESRVTPANPALKAKLSKIDQLKLMGPVILSGILKSLDAVSSSESDVTVRDSKTFAYQAIGLLSQRMPQLFRDKIDMAVRLFDALKVETQHFRLSIQEATNSLATAYKGAPSTVLKDLETLLLKNSQEVEIALEGLLLVKDDGQSMSQKQDLVYPKLGVMLDFILSQQPNLLESAEMREQKLHFPSKTYLVMIEFLLKCFESELEQNISIKGLSDFQSSVEALCLLLEHAMAFEGSVELHARASKALIAIGSCMPKLIASRYAQKVSWLKQLLSHVDLDTREAAARLLGFASSALATAESSALISELIASIPDTLFQSTLKCLVDVANSETAALASVAIQALGHIGLIVPLPSLIIDSNSVDILMVLHEKLRKLLSGDDTKAIQKIVISIGHMCVKETSSSRLNIALDLSFSLCRSKVEDVLFAVGEALSFLWGGVPVTADLILKANYSLSMASNFLMGDVNSSLSKNSHIETNEAEEDRYAMVRDAITKKLFDDLLYSTRKEERCAGTVWLLSITMYCGHNPAVQKMLPDIQEAFSHLLGEQNELTQELASQGMSIVYELGDASMKENLVHALVNSLTGSGKRKRAIKLVEDSEVFQEGVIGEGLSGGKLSTYKELCNRGAAFGFSKIAKQAGDALKPHLRSLIPRLVRYQYDPDKNVQDAMAHIWKSLVADSKKTIDENLDLIVDDLLIQCGSRLWRSRESSCLALADIIQGRKFDQVAKHLRKLWSAAFRAMDDIKETVRNSGDKLCRALTSLTVRLSDVSLTGVSEARQTMDIVLPFLLTEGILSKVDSIRKASIGIVMKLAKGAGIAIRPHLSDLVCCMLESLSSLEDQGLNYVENFNCKRLSMWETLDLCIKVVDSEALDQLVPRLAQLVRSGVGLNTRVGIASFITLLVQKVGVEIKPYTSRLLRLLFPVVKDEKSAASKRAFASACSIVLKHAAPTQAEMLIDDSAALHNGDKNAQVSCAILLKSYSSMASDVVSGYLAAIIPVIFISRFEDDKFVSGLFEELWEEHTSSERVALQLYLEEIVSLICEGIGSSSWASKKRSAQAISKLSEVLGESLSSHYHVLLQSLIKEIPGRLWEGKDALLSAIAALSVSCHKAISSDDPATMNEILSVVSSACTKKAKKYREAALSCLEQVVKAFGNQEFFNVVFPLLYEMFTSGTLTQSGKATLVVDAAKAEEDQVEKFSVPHNKVLDCMTACIHVAHINDIVGQQKNLMHVFIATMSSGLPWTVKISALSSTKELCSRLQKVLDDSQESPANANIISLVQELFLSMPPQIVECISTVKVAQVHVTASESLLVIIKLYQKLRPIRCIDVQFKDELVHLYEVEKNGEAKSLLKKCIDTLENLKQESVQDDSMRNESLSPMYKFLSKQGILHSTLENELISFYVAFRFMR
ncbi:ARM repeat superfamily protein [Prunus dulcis]|uniref:ARM repeat superfamily protein n=1 Tax=Prunus dulcis TaxID=3755 RepID=A0A4Y1REP3_PRUDU|nr:ARM repeat superfamily protein [Prunus dulcis]